MRCLSGIFFGFAEAPNVEVSLQTHVLGFSNIKATSAKVVLAVKSTSLYTFIPVWLSPERTRRSVKTGVHHSESLSLLSVVMRVQCHGHYEGLSGSLPGARLMSAIC